MLILYFRSVFTCIKGSCAATWCAKFCSAGLCSHWALASSNPSRPLMTSSRPPHPPPLPHSHRRSSRRTRCRAAHGRPRVSRARRATLLRSRTGRERDRPAHSPMSPLCCRGRNRALPTPLPTTNEYTSTYSLRNLMSVSWSFQIYEYTLYSL